MQDTAHGLRLAPLIKFQNQNLELVPNSMADSGGRRWSGCRGQNGMGPVDWIGNNIRAYA